MIVLGIIMLVIGVALCALGYLITFRGKYALIFHFIEDKRRGKFDTAYARRTGLLEILWGLISILAGILVISIRSTVFGWIIFCIVALGTACTLILNTWFSIKKK